MTSHKSESCTEDSDVDETLPIYASEEIPVQPPLPSPSASPREVREYIAQTLIVLGYLESEQAHSIAAKWRLGTGQELRQYPGTLYRDIFGLEDTWIVYRHIRPQILAEETAEAMLKRTATEEEPTTRRSKSMCLVLLENKAVNQELTPSVQLAVFVVMVSLFIILFSLSLVHNWTIVIVIGWLIIGLASAFVLFVSVEYCCGSEPSPPEQRVLEELHRLYTVPAETGEPSQQRSPAGNQ